MYVYLMTRKKSRFNFISFCFVLVSIYSIDCKKNSDILISDHTFVFEKNTISIQYLKPNNKDNIKNINFVIFDESTTDIENYKSVINDFLFSGYEITILKSDWKTILNTILSSPDSKNKDYIQLCELINNLHEKKNKNIVIAWDELVNFASLFQINTNCADGLIIISPSLNIKIDKNVDKLFSNPMLIITGEYDEKSYNLSLKLQQQNRSLCEIRTYPTDEHGLDVLLYSEHAKEQIKLWIDTITKTVN